MDGAAGTPSALNLESASKRETALPSGFIVTHYAPLAGFLGIAGVGLLAVAILWMLMPET